MHPCTCLHPRIRLLALAALLPLAAFQAASLACTAFQLRAADGSVVYCRSMEFGYPFNSKVLVIPRGTEFTGTAPGGAPGLRWTATLGAVGLNVDVAPGIVADGQNEKGLAVGMLYLPGYAKYLAPDHAKASRSIGGWEVATMLLTTCGTVDDAVAALRDKVHVAEQVFAPFGIVLPLHYWIGDASGRVVIAEYVDGALRIHDNPMGTLTNSPPFDWQRINLSNYVNLSPVNVPSRRLAGIDVPNFGQGSGAIGLPGDLTPPSRFVRATLFSQWAAPAADGPGTVNLGFHVLNAFDIFDGAIKSDTANQTENTKAFLSGGGPPKVVSTDTTEWVVAHDRTNRKTYVRTYGGMQIQVVDLAKVGLDRPGLRTIDLKERFEPEDVSALQKPLAVPPAGKGAPAGPR